MYKVDLAFDNPQWLIYHKTKQNQKQTEKQQKHEKKTQLDWYCELKTAKFASENTWKLY